MIVDILSEIITDLKSSLTGVNVVSPFPLTAPSFPCVTVEETSNTTRMDTVDSSGERFNDIVIEVNIFTNSTDKVSEARQIRSVIDTIISDGYGMNRGFSSPTPNFADLNVYRYTMRFDCSIDASKKIYRR